MISYAFGNYPISKGQAPLFAFRSIKWWVGGIFKDFMRTVFTSMISFFVFLQLVSNTQ